MIPSSQQSRDALLPGLSPQVQSLLSSLFSLDPKNRPRSTDLLYSWDMFTNLDAFAPHVSSAIDLVDTRQLAVLELSSAEADLDLRDPPRPCSPPPSLNHLPPMPSSPAAPHSPPNPSPRPSLHRQGLEHGEALLQESMSVAEILAQCGFSGTLSEYHSPSRVEQVTMVVELIRCGVLAQLISPKGALTHDFHHSAFPLMQMHVSAITGRLFLIRSRFLLSLK